MLLFDIVFFWIGIRRRRFSGVIWRIDESVYFSYTLVLVFYGTGARFLSVIFELFLSVLLGWR